MTQQDEWRSLNPYKRFTKWLCRTRCIDTYLADVGTVEGAVTNIFDSPTERDFAQLWEAHYPEIDLHLHVRFHPTRRWSFDFAYVRSRTQCAECGNKGL
ncbi:hypothetical protein [Synechococcus sp. PCC 7336]|uniref:hypothetical protein n=1 Tax=Synechococcus sp. PCC 7336 TaxID=195250 RepID=UPI0003461850|nr:hypothetical protein [Synechococcus sp. PCC 7336]